LVPGIVGGPEIPGPRPIEKAGARARRLAAKVRADLVASKSLRRRGLDDTIGRVCSSRSLIALRRPGASAQADAVSA